MQEYYKLAKTDARVIQIGQKDARVLQIGQK